MFLTATEVPDLDIDIKAVKSFLDGLDPTTLLPNIDSLVGTVRTICVIALLIAPILMLVKGIGYLFFTPKEANYYLGYRTTFGMGSVSAWRKTQKLAGLVFSILGLALTVIMLLIAMTLSSREAMSMVWLTAKCLIWQGVLALLAIAAINFITMSRFDYNGVRRKKRK